jgi:hypothetical protein
MNITSTSPHSDGGGAPLDRDVRAWAKKHGYDLAPDEEIPAAVLAAYLEAHEGTAP